tara:strand:+ start:19350 stop:19526 length:177 start_codon:yes stop_codon:yes gene_type:complete
MNDPYCKHGNHLSIRCFRCEQDKIAASKLRPIKKQVSDSEKREQAKKRVYEAAKGLDW